MLSVSGPHFELASWVLLVFASGALLMAVKLTWAAVRMHQLRNVAMANTVIAKLEDDAPNYRTPRRALALASLWLIGGLLVTAAALYIR